MRYTTARFGEVTHLLGEFSANRRPAQSFTVVDLTTERALIVNHGYRNGDGPHQLTTTGTLPTPLSGNTDYWLISGTSSGVAFATSRANALAGTAINLTASGTGTHTLNNPITIRLAQLPNTNIPVTLSGCTEVTSLRALSGDAFSTYAWPTSLIVTPPSVQTEIVYQMRDAYTGRTQKGKIVVGGFPDESARRRYQNEVHLRSGGTALPTETTSGAATFVFSTGATDLISGTGNWNAAFAVGRRVQVSGATNLGVTTPIVAISGNFLVFSGGRGFSHGAFQATTETSTLTVKTFAFPRGTEEDPAGNLLDARQIADNLQFSTYHLLNGLALTVNFPHDNWMFLGTDPDADIVTFSGGSSNVESSFQGVGIRGALNGRIVASECYVGAAAQTLTGLEGTLNRVGGAGVWELKSGGIVTAIDTGARDLVGVTLDYSDTGAPKAFLAGSILGIWGVSSSTEAGNIFGVTGQGSEITIGASNTAGIARLGGVGEPVNATGGMTVIDEMLRGTRLNATVGSRATPAQAADSVWDELLGDHLGGGSTGAALALISGFGAPPAAGSVADAVWDETRAGHTTPGTYGEHTGDAAMRGTDGANTTVPLAAAADQAEHDSTQAAIAGLTTPPTAAAIADAVWDEVIAGHTTSGTTGRNLYDARRHITNDREIDRGTDPWTEVLYDDDGSTPLQVATLSGGDVSVEAINNTNRPAGVLISKRTVQ